MIEIYPFPDAKKQPFKNHRTGFVAYFFIIITSLLKHIPSSGLPGVAL